MNCIMAIYLYTLTLTCTPHLESRETQYNLLNGRTYTMVGHWCHKSLFYA